MKSFRSAITARKAGMNSNPPSANSPVFMCFSISGEQVKPPKRSKFSEKRKAEVMEVRKQGACLRCRILKRTCSGNNPCDNCVNVINAAHGSRVLQWTECVRYTLEDVNLFWDRCMVDGLTIKESHAHDSEFEWSTDIALTVHLSESSMDTTDGDWWYIIVHRLEMIHPGWDKIPPVLKNSHSFKIALLVSHLDYIMKKSSLQDPSHGRDYYVLLESSLISIFMMLLVEFSSNMLSDGFYHNEDPGDPDDRIKALFRLIFYYMEVCLRIRGNWAKPDSGNKPWWFVDNSEENLYYLQFKAIREKDNRKRCQNISQATEAYRTILSAQDKQDRILEAVYSRENELALSARANQVSRGTRSTLSTNVFCFPASALVDLRDRDRAREVNTDCEIENQAFNGDEPPALSVQESPWPEDQSAALDFDIDFDAALEAQFEAMEGKQNDFSNEYGTDANPFTALDGDLEKDFGHGFTPELLE